MKTPTTSVTCGKRYTDPITGKDDWRLIHVGEAKVPVMGFFGQPLQGAGTGSATTGMMNNGTGGIGNGSSTSGFGGSSTGSSFGSTGSSSFGNTGSSSFGSSSGGVFIHRPIIRRFDGHVWIQRLYRRHGRQQRHVGRGAALCRA